MRLQRTSQLRVIVFKRGTTTTTTKTTTTPTAAAKIQPGTSQPTLYYSDNELHGHELRKVKVA
jgi:hypothetical protein